MNKNLYLKELKRNRKNLMIWSAIVIGFTLMVTAIFPYMAEMGDNITVLMDSIPAELGKALGVDADTWSSILGFYSTYYSIYIILLVSIYTASTGATIISKEEKEGTSEFLLTKPVSRQTIVFSKLMSLFTLSLIIFAIQTITALISINAFATSSVNWGVFTQMHLSGLIIILFFTAAGVLISMFVTPKKNFMGIVVGMTFGTYFLNAIGKSAEAVEWISYISPFRYLEITKDPTVSFNYVGALILLVIAGGMLYLVNRVYMKKDIAG
ncbi:MAG: ABC transporter permease subunit [Crocinitomicaceae bacterium]|nr:ABC transporter permease subunit [Crocinitomicaceae bacterium]